MLYNFNNLNPNPFTYNSPCIWVAYDPGALGDMLASIISLHVDTDGKFQGFTDRGQVRFRPSDIQFSQFRFDSGLGDFCDKRITIDDQLINYINQQNGGNRIEAISMFRGHQSSNENIEIILSKLPNCKIINIHTTNSKYEHSLAYTLTHYKNFGELVLFDDQIHKCIKPSSVVYDHPRVLNVALHELLNEDEFNNLYLRILEFLEIPPYPFVTFGLIEYWISQQHPEIQKLIYNGPV